ncbi:MAG: hypothetical protein ACOX52_22885 [Verrucomicrobiota bacterium]
MPIRQIIVEIEIEIGIEIRIDPCFVWRLALMDRSSFAAGGLPIPLLCASARVLPGSLALTHSGLPTPVLDRRPIRERMMA